MMGEPSSNDVGFGPVISATDVMGELSAATSAESETGVVFTPPSLSILTNATCRPFRLVATNAAALPRPVDSGVIDLPKSWVSNPLGAPMLRTGASAARSANIVQLHPAPPARRPSAVTNKQQPQPTISRV